MAVSDMMATLSGLGFEHVLLWLLTFAIFNGLMGQAKILDKARETRAIISIVAGLFVIIAVPTELISVISNMSAGMILVVMAILVVMVFFEAMGVKHRNRQMVGQDKQGKPVWDIDEESLFTKHKYIMAAVLIIAAVLIFFGSGGASILGGQGIEITEETITSITLIIVVMVAIIWMISGKNA